MNRTSIEWVNRSGTTPFTWNPIRARLNICPGIKRANGTDIQCGHRHDLAHKVCQAEGCPCDRKQTGTFCTRISPGCTNCYASAINKRFGNGLEYTVPNLEKVEFVVDEKILAEPLKRKKPATIFAGDMNDLFHEAIPDDFIYEVFGIAYGAHWHTLQLLTKRAERLHRFFANFCIARLAKIIHARHIKSKPQDADYLSVADIASDIQWPLPNVWLGVSVEDQPRADERVPELLQTPAAVRFLSVEPMLEAVDLSRVDYRWQLREVLQKAMGLTDQGAIEQVPNGDLSSGEGNPYLDVLNGRWFDGWDSGNDGQKIDWVIVGGESGHGARPFNLAWAESLHEQCKAAGVAFFCKQLGSNPWQLTESEPKVSMPYRVSNSKGGDMNE